MDKIRNNCKEIQKHKTQAKQKQTLVDLKSTLKVVTNRSDVAESVISEVEYKLD